MDAIQRAQVERDARGSQSAGPKGFVAVLLMLVLTGLAFYLNRILGLFAAALCALILIARLRPQKTAAPDEPAATEPVSMRRSNSLSKGAFISMGDTNQTKLMSSGLLRAQAQKAPPPPEIPAEPEPAPTPETSFALFCAQSPRAIAQEQREILIQGLAAAAKKISIIDPLLTSRMHKNRQSELESILKAKDIVAALQARSTSLAQLLSKQHWESSDVQQAWLLCFGEVDIRRDPMSSLMSDQSGEKLSPNGCQALLEAIFNQLMKRKTFYQALQKEGL